MRRKSVSTQRSCGQVRSAVNPLSNYHRSAMAHHVERSANMGTSVLISKSWYYLVHSGNYKEVGDRIEDRSVKTLVPLGKLK